MAEKFVFTLESITLATANRVSEESLKTATQSVDPTVQGSLATPHSLRTDESILGHGE